MGKLRAAHPARRLAVAAALCAALLAGAEAGLRAAKIGAPAWHRPDPLLGWTLRPFAGSHGAQYGEVNAFGQRDNRHCQDKLEGVYRVAVLGDEHSEAPGVRLRDAWWHQLPARLDACGYAPGKKIEVLNFGVSGYSTAQESLVLETAVMRYRPDLVLLQLSAGKDIRENSRALATRVDRPFYWLDDRGRLRLDVSFLERPDFERRSQFRYELAREIADHSRLVRVLAGMTVAGSAHAGAPPALDAPQDARWQDAWRVTGAILARMRDFSRRNGAAFVVVAVPGDARTGSRIGSFGARNGIPVIPVHARSGEWTPEDHRAAAQGAAAGLCGALGKGTALPAPVAPANGLQGRLLDEERHGAREEHGDQGGGRDTG